MPRNTRALTLAARKRARERELPYQTARADVLAIRELMDEGDLTFAEAEAFYDDPANQLLCKVCGWTVGMICPECTPGCGCNNLRCSGWRHQEYMDSDELEELNACGDCGGDTTSPYGCGCGE
ncbi:hypothetical protein [Amycolatopsis magusensis]|uniref:hypothetical protein n=1 Tax=Amycolatopsis magusensis TaxID=882444 RepID=UPI0037A8450F